MLTLHDVLMYQEPAAKPHSRRTSLDDETFVPPPRALSPAYRAKPLSTTPTSAGPHRLRSGTIDQIVWRVREHITALINVALSIDIIQRPKRPVLDRRRSTIIEIDTLGPELLT